MKLYALVLTTVLFALPACAETIRLVDAKVDAVVAYFSKLTGKQYILNFDTDQTFSMSVERDFTPTELDDLFDQIIEDLGGSVIRLSENTFSVETKTPDLMPASGLPSLSAEAVQTSLRRVSFRDRINASSVTQLIAALPEFSSLKIISDDFDSSSVLIVGDEALIDRFVTMVSTLPEKIKKAPEDESNLTDKTIAAPTDTIGVFDLSFADASEVVQSLQPLLLGDGDASDVTIAAHQSANQIIVSGSQEAITIAQDAIKLLDRAPRQVYVDVIIAEVSEESAQKLGLQFAINGDQMSASLVTGVAGSNIGSFAGNAFLTGASGGIVAIGRGAGTIPDIGLMLSALKGDTDNRVLATPSLMTTENKESSILVGQNIPFITGQFTNSNGDASAPFQTIQRADVGTSLRLKPKIGPTGNIIMEVWQEISRIDTTAATMTDIVTAKRQISTVVSAQEGETIAIGGLRVEQEEQSVSKVPFLSDIPVLGNLFRQESVTTVSRNLVIFLRPTLVSSKKQRLKVLTDWTSAIGADLLSYENPKTKFSVSEPVGKRLAVPGLIKKIQNSMVKK